MRGHRKLEILHSGPFDELALVRLRVVARQVDDGFDPESCESFVVMPRGLSTTVVAPTHASEVVDPNL